MNKYIAKYLFYYPIQYVRGQQINSCLQEVKSYQLKSNNEICDFKNQKLAKLISCAYQNVPYYNKKFTDLNILPQRIKNQDNLKGLPVLPKRDVLNNEHAMVDQKFKGTLYTRKTGGSTGMTLHFKKEAKALALNEAIMWRCYDWYGVDIGDRQVRFWGVPVTKKLRWKEQLKDFVLNRIRISAFDIAKKSCLKQYEKIRRFKPAYFYGYTTAIYGFCLFMKENKIDLNKLNLKAVICTLQKRCTLTTGNSSMRFLNVRLWMNMAVLNMELLPFNAKKGICT